VAATEPSGLEIMEDPEAIFEEGAALRSHLAERGQ
jgi:hypothetical protein